MRATAQSDPIVIESASSIRGSDHHYKSHSTRLLLISSCLDLTPQANVNSKSNIMPQHQLQLQLTLLNLFVTLPTCIETSLDTKSINHVDSNGSTLHTGNRISFGNPAYMFHSISWHLAQRQEQPPFTIHNTQYCIYYIAYF